MICAAILVFLSTGAALAFAATKVPSHAALLESFRRNPDSPQSRHSRRHVADRVLSHPNRAQSCGKTGSSTGCGGLVSVCRKLMRSAFSLADKASGRIAGARLERAMPPRS